MKKWFIRIFCITLSSAACIASTLNIVPIYEPISLHGTDMAGARSDIGEALQATVMPRPMALTGAFPEALVDAIRSPHLIPSNHPNYKVQETNLLVICNVGITGQMVNSTLMVKINIEQLAIPTEIDLTARQILKLTLIALRKTLEDHQRIQRRPLPVEVIIDGAEDGKVGLRELSTKYLLDENTADEPKPPVNHPDPRR